MTKFFVVIVLIWNAGAVQISTKINGEENRFNIGNSVPKILEIPSDSDTQNDSIIEAAKWKTVNLRDTAEDREVESNGNGNKRKCIPYLEACKKNKNKDCCPNLNCVETSNNKFFCVPPNPDSTSDTKKCPYTARIEQILEPLRSGPEFEATLDSLKRRKDASIRAAATRGNVTQNFQLTLRSIHLQMRSHYKDMINEIGTNIYPLIVASDQDNTGVGYVSGVGGIFTLYLEDGRVKRIIPTSKEFEMLKNLAHIPLGVFTIISPHFLTPEGLEKGKLESFQGKIKEAIAAGNLVMTMNRGNHDELMSRKLVDDSMKMLTVTKNHVDIWLRRGMVTVEDFEGYTRIVYPLIEEGIKTAARLQVDALLPHLKEWKDELGEKWKDVYAIIPTIWPVSAINPRLQVLAQLMSPEQVKTQVILLENGGTLAEKRATLGRIVGDRAAAQLILNTNPTNPEQNKLTFALSTKQDLLSNSCADAIQEFFRTNDKNEYTARKK